MRIKHLVSSLLTVVALSISGTVAAETVLKFSIGAPDGPGGEIFGMKALKEYVEFKSGGQLQIRLFFNTFGGSQQVTEQVKNGTLEMALTDDSVLGSFYKPMQIFQITAQGSRTSSRHCAPTDISGLLQREGEGHRGGVGVLIVGRVGGLPATAREREREPVGAGRELCAVRPDDDRPTAVA